MHRFLSLDHPFDHADILIIEGWLDHNELDFVAQLYKKNNYKYLITTGYPLNKELLMYKNGTYCLKTDQVVPDTADLQISVQGTLPCEYASAFRVYVNNEFIANDSVGKHLRKFNFRLFNRDTIRSVSIKFTNDAIVKGKDRNLLVYSVSINEIQYPALDTLASYSIQTMDDSTIFNLAGTQALLTRNHLLRRGISKNKIIAINYRKDGISRTLSTARHTIAAIDSILTTTNYTANIVSVPPHTRRTYTAFCKFHPKIKLGITPVPKAYIKDPQVKRLKNIHELLGILFIKLHP